MNDEWFFDPSPSVRDVLRVDVLKGPKWRPVDVDDFPPGRALLADCHALLMRRLDEPRSFPTRAIIDFGVQPRPHLRIENQWTLRNDETNAFLGEYEVVGVIVYGMTGAVSRTYGDVGKRKISTARFVFCEAASLAAERLKVD